MKLSKGGIVLKALSFIFLICGAILVLFPFFITIITAFKTPQESTENFFRT